jgi:release factor glutamine methyltransferase
MALMLSWGRIRRALQPRVLKYWLNDRLKNSLTTRVEGFELSVFPTVFHPRYFGSSCILARFVSSLNLAEKSFLDVGCGSGIVAMCAARAGARVTAVDINPEAVRCTLTNAERHGLKVDARTGDLFSSLGDARFDIIAWNPPFLPGTPASLAETAFFGGPRFDVIRRFVDSVGNHINEGASVYTILSADIDIAAIEEMFRNHGFTVTRVLSKRWLLGETMVILRAAVAVSRRTD